jgi:hypothetical protein
VEKQGITIKEAAKKLRINYSTAKHIVKIFRRTGQVETVLMQKRKRRIAALGYNSDGEEEEQFDFHPSQGKKINDEKNDTFDFSTAGSPSIQDVKSNDGSVKQSFFANPKEEEVSLLSSEQKSILFEFINFKSYDELISRSFCRRAQ